MSWLRSLRSTLGFNNGKPCDDNGNLDRTNATSWTNMIHWFLLNFAGGLVFLWHAGVVVFLGVVYLSSLDTSSPWSASATTTLADTLPLLCWRMLCRPDSLGLADTLPLLLLLLWRMLCRRDCAACWSSPVDALPPWCCYFWWMLGHPLVVSWSQSATSVILFFV